MSGNKVCPPDHLLEVGSYWKHKVTLTAVKLGLFNYLSNGSRTPTELAEQFNSNAQAFSIFLNALTGMGLLLKRGGKFANTPFVKRFLIRGGPHYKGDQLIFDDMQWDLWGQLEHPLTTGNRPLQASIFHKDPKATERLILGLHQDALRIAPKLAKRLPVNRWRKLLDLGGGAGTYSIVFCQRNLALKATIFDLSNTTRVTRAVVEAAGLEGRINVIDGDFLTDPIPGSYDAVFMSNILHGQGPEQNVEVFQKVKRCLIPKGDVVVRDVIMDEDLTHPEWGAVFAVNMMLHADGGRCYSSQEISRWLHRVGFGAIRVVDPNSVLMAENPG